MYSRRNEISEAVFEDGTSLTKKAEEERKKLQNVYAPMLRVLNCVLLTVEIKREGAVSVSQM